MPDQRERGRQSNDDANARSQNLCRCQTGNLMLIMHESAHVGSGQVFDQSAEGSPNPAAVQRQMDWQSSERIHMTCLRPTRCTLSLSRMWL
jgi:hypothetical protein